MLGYFSASIIHQTLTWTTGSLTCASDPLASLSLSLSIYIYIPTGYLGLQYHPKDLKAYVSKTAVFCFCFVFCLFVFYGWQFCKNSWARKQETNWYNITTFSQLQAWTWKSPHIETQHVKEVVNSAMYTKQSQNALFIFCVWHQKSDRHSVQPCKLNCF